MKYLTFALSIVGILVGVDACSQPTSGYSETAAPPQLTKDRLSDDEMRQIVKIPLEEFRKGDIEGGERDFDELLKHTTQVSGFGSTAVADALSAMGVQLWIVASDPENKPIEQKAIDYMSQAIPASRLAFGDRSPETALAITDYITASLNLNRDNPSETLDDLALDAYRIRLSTLGAENSETIEALSTLAGLKGLPSRTAGDPAQVATSAKMFKHAADLASSNALLGPRYVAGTYLKLARMYALNGDLPSAKESFAQAESSFAPPSPPDPSVRDLFVLNVYDLASTFEKKGFTKDASDIRHKYSKEMSDLISRAKRQ